MKTYEETARDVLTRRDEYKETRKRRIRTLAASLSSFAVVAVIAVGVMVFGAKRDDVPVAAGDNTNDPIPTGTYSETGKENGEESVPSGTAITDSGIDSHGDAIGWLVIDGVYYEQTGAGAIDGDSMYLPCLDEYLGRAEDFDGAYRNGIEGVTGEVYRVHWEDADIFVILSNGAFITLKDNGGTPVVSGTGQFDSDAVYY